MPQWSLCPSSTEAANGSGHGRSDPMDTAVQVRSRNCGAECHHALTLDEVAVEVEGRRHEERRRDLLLLDEMTVAHSNLPEINWRDFAAVRGGFIEGGEKAEV